MCEMLDPINFHYMDETTETAFSFSFLGEISLWHYRERYAPRKYAELWTLGPNVSFHDILATSNSLLKL